MSQNVQAFAKVKKPLVAKKAVQQSAKTAQRVASKSLATPTKAVAVKVAPVKAAPAKGVSAKGVSAKATVKPSAKSVVKETKPAKQKLVRDSFTFPQAEYLVLVGMKKRLLAAGTDVKKGELVRAGISLLARLDDVALAKALLTVEKLKTGRPAK